jgi:hypothetical protein
VSIYKIQFQDNENLDKRHRNEIATLQRSIQDTARENQDRVHEINVKIFISKNFLYSYYTLFRN